eukprot:CAMPEP_0185356870 /NCGR_PEP_ID=MMETSP1364-20130426/7056_1 /TAXON_ID=38817 /ORGANISM="Gephyrocapsa oceanica, Strain RCC1303" /LENGTH=170 /DNA_ID=CAMNT_0027956829 /DNA_START=405 /DNA_END=914 /DNA_ORIENTATION=+
MALVCCSMPSGDGDLEALFLKAGVSENLIGRYLRSLLEAGVANVGDLREAAEEFPGDVRKCLPPLTILRLSKHEDGLKSLLPSDYGGNARAVGQAATEAADGAEEGGEVDSSRCPEIKLKILCRLQGGSEVWLKEALLKKRHPELLTAFNNQAPSLLPPEVAAAAATTTT